MIEFRYVLQTADHTHNVHTRNEHMKL